MELDVSITLYFDHWSYVKLNRIRQSWFRGSFIDHHPDMICKVQPEIVSLPNYYNKLNLTFRVTLSIYHPQCHIWFVTISVFEYDVAWRISIDFVLLKDITNANTNTQRVFCHSSSSPLEMQMTKPQCFIVIQLHHFIYANESTEIFDTLSYEMLPSWNVKHIII